MSNEIELSQGQEEAYHRIIDWYWYTTKAEIQDKNYRNYEYFVLGGYAGTGKTTMVGEVVRELEKLDENIHISFLAPTNKAAAVLSQKINREVLTIHKWMYHVDWQDEVVEGKNGKSKIIQKPKFIKKSINDMHDNLLIIDEASMISRKLFLDLLSYNIRIVFLGDHGQLPPVTSVKDDFSVMKELDAELKEVHRQGLGNPILHLANNIREGFNLRFADKGRYGKAGDVWVAPKNKLEDLIVHLHEKDELSETMFLCLSNRSRVMINSKIRLELFSDATQPPLSGEKIVGMASNPSLGLFNGIVYTLQSDVEVVTKETKTGNKYFEWWADLYDEAVEVEYPEVKLNNKQFLSKTRENGRDDEFGADYAYCLTVHKSQGSEAKNVVLYNDAPPPYPIGSWEQFDKDYQQRWWYTAVTRAKEKLYILT